MLYMLDTDTASYIIKQRSPELESRLSRVDPSNLCVSAVTCAELLYGLKRLSPSHKLHAGVRQFLKLVRVLSWDAEAASFYAAIRHQLVTEGQPIGEMDMMIAAHALSAAATLVTNNLRHYERIQAPLLLDNWFEPAP
jgi:tRNA(fMet)-specific endonuclease VapC